MKMRHLFFLFIPPLCCFGERDYKMVDLKNGLTTELLAVGPTSITISVEWPLDMRPYGDMACFGLMGKTDINERGWHCLMSFSTDQTKGKVIREILYEDTSWHYFKETTNFEKKVWFAVRVPAPTDALVGVGFRGMNEEDDEIDDEAFERAQRKVIEEFNREVAEAALEDTRKWHEALERLPPEVKEELFKGWSLPPLPSRETEGGAEEKEKNGEVVSPPNLNLWLYVGIVLGICAVSYFVRRKLKTNN